MKKLLLFFVVCFFITGCRPSDEPEHSEKHNTNIKESVHENVQTAGASQIAVSLRTMDMRPLEECYKDETCSFYTLNINLNGRNHIETLIDEDVRKDTTSVSSISWMNPATNKTHTNKLYIIDADSSIECVYDLECSWYAFYNLINRSVMGVNADGIINKRIKDVEYYLYPPEYNKHFYKVLNILDQVRHYFSYKIEKNKVFTALFFFSENIEEDIYVNHKEFLRKILEDTDIIEQSFRKSSNPAEPELCANYPFIGKSANKEILGSVSFIKIGNDTARYCIKKSVLISLGVDGVLPDFPFSIMSRTENNEISEIDKSHNFKFLDLFILHALYQPEFKSGMKTDYQEMREIYERIYPRVIETFQTAHPV